MDINYQIKFENRERQLTELEDVAFPLKVIDSPAGYGKTYVINRLCEDFTNRKWKCAIIDLSIIRGPQNIRNAIADRLQLQFSRDLRTDKELKSAIAINEKIVFLFDSVERTDESELNWLLTFIDDCRRGARSLELLVFFAGRYIYAGERAGRWIRNRYKVVYLSPLTSDVIRKVLKNYPKNIERNIQNEEFTTWAEKIARLTGGHPRSIENLVKELAWSNWSLSFSQEEISPLFEKYISPAIRETLSGLSESAQSAIEIISIFRKVNIQLILGFQKLTLLSSDIDPRLLISELSNFGIRRPVSESIFYVDDTLRYLIISRLRYLNNDDYKDYNNKAQSILESCIGMFQPTMELPFPIDGLIKSFVTEIIYHRFQQSSTPNELIRCIIDAQQLLIQTLGPDKESIDYKIWLEDTVNADKDLSEVVEERSLSIEHLFRFAFPEGQEDKYLPVNESRSQVVMIEAIIDSSIMISDCLIEIFEIDTLHVQVDNTNSSDDLSTSINSNILPFLAQNQLRKTLIDMNLTFPETQLDEIKALNNNLVELKRHWGDYRMMEEEPTGSSQSRVETKEKREDKEKEIRKKIKAICRRIERISNRKVTLPHF